MGQPHSLIRHPDMPPEAYKDLWATIGRGRNWTGIVKNRRKNGDFYWVRANVTPMMVAGKPRSYMSVRVKPTRDEVRAAEALYAQIREERERGASSFWLHAGRVRRPGLRNQLGKLQRFGLTQRLVALLEGRGAALQGPALSQQGTLVDEGADEVRQLVLRIFDARDVQVAGQLAAVTDGEHHLGGLALAFALCLGQGLLHLADMGLAHKRHQRHQGAIGLGGLKAPVCHRIGLRHDVVLVDHHQRQGHAGEQGLETLRGALRVGLAVAQDLVLALQLGHEPAQHLGAVCRQRPSRIGHILGVKGG